MRRALMILAACLALAAAAFYPANPVTRSAQTYAGTVAAASGGVYLTLRSLNAILSTAQEVEVGGAFVVQGSAQPFKVLEPVDDTVERVAQLVFYVMVVTGVLAVAMGPVTGIGFAMAALALTAGAFARAGSSGALGTLARRLGLYGAFLGLALPLSFLLSSLVADRMTQAIWDKHSTVVAEITANVAPDIAPGIAAEEPSSGVLSVLQGARDNLDRYSDLAANIYARADELATSLVALLSVFLFKVLILPGLILGGFFVSVRVFAHDRPAEPPRTPGT